MILLFVLTTTWCCETVGKDVLKMGVFSGPKGKTIHPDKLNTEVHDMRRKVDDRLSVGKTQLVFETLPWKKQFIVFTVG